MAIYRTLRRTARDFTMVRAGLLLALLALVQLLGAVQDSRGEMASGMMLPFEAIPALLQDCDKAAEPGPLI
ncbi:hypothetical protein M4578_00545 [Salipiger sp. P9]|uniref:hypothetical protein n=1 Tax=Salipiger pentaromativorans TaxID=2943193 RepID=UPI0021589DD1|nr:hypothetical protein [Salipiger pentaromativorans]MCR8546298.1 hypothetical protein [Salipiger pentaromativorans]